MTLTETVWWTPDKTRHFIIPDGEPRRPGTFAVRSLAEDEAEVDPAWAGRFEVSEEEARRWAQEEFGFALAELRRRIDIKLAKARRSLDAAKSSQVGPDTAITPDAVPALFLLARKLPRAILDSLSGEPDRVVKASGELAALRERLNAAGIDVDQRLSDFPYRLAGLRRDFELSRKRDDRPS